MFKNLVYYIVAIVYFIGKLNKIHTFKSQRQILLRSKLY